MGRYLDMAASPFRWTKRQFAGFYRGVRGYIGDFRVDDVLLPSLIDTANWIFGLFPKAVGVRQTTPKEQIDANIVFIFFWGGLSILSLGATLALVAVHVLLLLIGLYRYFPAFGNLWRRFRSKLPVKGDYDIPLWRSE